MTEQPLAIGIVCHNAYGAMTGGRTGQIGGVEWQTSLTARWLAARGHAVNLLTWGGGPDELVDGVRIVKICPQGDGLRGLRFFHPRWSGLVGALSRADCDVYYQNGAEVTTGQVALWCRRRGRAFVFSSACDTDCDVRLPLMPAARTRLFYRYGLRAADVVIVQTETQRRLLSAGFGLESLVIPMPCPGPSDQEYEPRQQPTSPSALWIARVCRQKRPDRLLDVARLCPDLSFDMVGPIEDSSYAAGVAEEARSLPNVTVHGPVPREAVYDFYRRAGCLFSTSDFEGFPNTFLEAWSHGLPIVSTFDPDSVITRHGLGLVATDTEELAAGLRRLLESPELHLLKSRQARSYYREHHAAETVLPRFERAFLDAARRHGRVRTGPATAETALEDFPRR